jgi:hypothetical protein
MRTMYRCFFPLADPYGVGGALIDEIADRVQLWSGRPGRPEGAEALDWLDYEQGQQGCSSRAVAAGDDGERIWAYRFLKIDSLDSLVTWQVDIAVEEIEGGDGSEGGEDGEGKRTRGCRFSLGLLLGDESGRLRPLRRHATRPRIVPSLLEDFDCPVGLRATPRKIHADEGEIESFVDLLLDEERSHPSILVSPERQSGVPISDAQRLPDQLAGLAVVHVLHGPEAGKLLGERIGQRQVPVGGGVRLFWPGWTQQSPLREHPTFSAPRIVEARRLATGGFAGYLLDRVAQQAVLFAPQGYPNWQKAFTRFYREELRGQEELSDEVVEWIQELENENSDLENELEREREERVGLEKECERLRWELRSAQDRSRTSGAAQGAKGGKGAPSGKPKSFASLSAVLQSVVSDYPDRLVVQLNKQSNKKYRYSDPNEAFTALTWLATDYYEWRIRERGSLTHRQLDTELRSRCGWMYRPNQSKETVGEFESWYQTRFRGEDLEIHEHIGKGNTKRQGEKSIRIAFAWHEKTRRVVIGFVGQHQRTRAS